MKNNNDLGIVKVTAYKCLLCGTLFNRKEYAINCCKGLK